MEPTKGNYACKVCGKVSIGTGAHHSHQSRCVAKQMKRHAESTGVTQTTPNAPTAMSVDATSTSLSVVAFQGGDDGREVTPQVSDIHLGSENRYLIQSVLDVLPPTIVPVTQTIRRTEGLWSTTANPIVKRLG